MTGVDREVRLQALDMALRAQEKTDTPENIIRRAQVFLAFLTAADTAAKP